MSVEKLITKKELIDKIARVRRLLIKKRFLKKFPFRNVWIQIKDVKEPLTIALRKNIKLSYIREAKREEEIKTVEQIAKEFGFKNWQLSEVKKLETEIKKEINSNRRYIDNQIEKRAKFNK